MKKLGKLFNKKKDYGEKAHFDSFVEVVLELD
jgi:hypothetical protein